MPRSRPAEFLPSTAAAGWVQQRVNVAVAPVMLLTAVVETRPDYASASELFAGMAPALHAQVGDVGLGAPPSSL